MFGDKWYQFWVKFPPDPGELSFAVKRCEPILKRFTCAPVAPDGTPVVNEDGTVEIRAFNKMGFSMAKLYMEDQGFVIEREQENSPEGNQ